MRTPARLRRSCGAALATTATALVVTACGGTGASTETRPEATATPTTGSPTTSAAPSETAATATAAGVVITVRTSEYGPMLFDQRGQAIYLFDKETTSTPACYDECAALWPPVLTDSAPRPMGADPNLLGTTQRDDGSTQVTYGGHPLYFYANEDPGQVLCHDVDDFGGTWLVVTPAGTPAPV